MLPPSGRVKLNVDASHGLRSASGGAILCDSRGRVITAIAFHLPVSEPQTAELQAALISLIYFARNYSSIDLEVDPTGLVNLVYDGLSPGAYSCLLSCPWSPYFETSAEAGQCCCPLSCSLRPAS